jgi:hypothetical protein
MQTYSFELLFLPPKRGHGPRASEVRLKTYTKGGYAGIPDAPTITQQCLTYRELSCEIDRLIGELENIRKRLIKSIANHAPPEIDHDPCLRKILAALPEALHLDATGASTAPLAM